MAVLCLGALLAGLVAASVMPFPPFACAVMAAMVIGSAWAINGGASAVQTFQSAIALLFTSQIAYGVGLLAVAFVSRVLTATRRARGEKQGGRPVQPLRTGNEPR